MSLKEYYLAQQAIFQPVLDAPKPNYLDIEHVGEQEVEDYITNYTIADHHRTQLHQHFQNALKTLTDDQLKAVFGKLKGPETEKRLSEKRFIRELRGGATTVFLNTALFGKTLEQMLDIYEEALGPEKVNELIHAPIQPHPLSPDYKDSKVYSPNEAYVQALRDKYTHTDDAAKNAENEALLQKVSLALQDVKPEVLAGYNHFRANGTIPEYASYDTIMGHRAELLRQQGLQSFGGGQFKDMVKPGTDSKGQPIFSITETNEYPNPMSAEQANELDRQSANPNVGLSEDTRQAVRELSQCMDELHFERFGAPLSGESFPFQRPKSPDDKFFASEEGTKYYAFRPVSKAKQNLLAAVKSGDLEEVRKAQQAYEEAEASTDKAFEILGSDKLNQAPLFSANVESTRASTDDVPEKYALDTTKQKKLNSLYVGYAALKSAGLTLDDLCKDPAKTAKTLGKQLLASSGLNARPGSIGATLQNGMKGTFGVGSPDTQIRKAWVDLDGAMSRCMSGIIGMEKDPKRSGEFLAAFHLGLREATEEVLKEAKRYETMGKLCTDDGLRYAGMRGTLYQSAAVLPETGENALDLEKMIDSFGEPDQVLKPGLRLEDAKPRDIRYSWQNAMDSANAYASGNRAYNWAELADRNRKVIEDAAREESVSGSYMNRFNADQYLIHAFSAQSRLANNAAARGENSETFQSFRESVKNTWTQAKNPNAKAILKLGSILMDDPTALDFLQTSKNDQIYKSDSKEYQNMKKSLAKIHKVKELVSVGNPMKLELLYESDFCKDLEKAKQDAFEYARLKTKNGSKTSFHYESGQRRYEEGMRNYRKLTQLQDELNLRSPAQKAYEDARMELLSNRADIRWLYGPEGKAVMAKMLYARSFMDAKIPAEHQKKHFRPEAIERGVNAIVTNRLQHFEHPAELESLADQALKHSGVFKTAAANLGAQRREAYDRAMAEPRLKQARQECAMGFALDQAAKSLGISYQLQTYSRRNPAIREKAEKIMKDPEFQEIMQRVTEGMTIEELEELHEPANLDISNSAAREAFARQKQSLQYEKRCAAVAAEASLRSKNEGKDPSQKEIDKLAAAIRKEQSFRAFMQEKQSKFRRAADFTSAMNALNFENSKNQFLTEMAQKIHAPGLHQIVPNANQPQVVQAPQQQNQGVVQEEPQEHQNGQNELQLQ